MKIAILTSFGEFLPGYSLSGIVLDQVQMFLDYGHEVHLFVHDRFTRKDTKIPEGLIIEKLVPFAHLEDYSSMLTISPDHLNIIKSTFDMLRTELAGYDAVLDHDWLFTGWNLPYGLGLLEASHYFPNTPFLHWIHSVPTGHKNWWDIRLYQKYNRKHKVVFPNATDRVLIAEQYRADVEDIRVIPHIKDLRSWFDFNPVTRQFIKDFPAIMQNEIVQIYPASGDRLEAKRVREVIKMFGAIKKMGKSVALAIVNQWSTTQEHHDNVEKYMAVGEAVGLVPGELIFTSEWKEEYQVGLPPWILRELMMLGNLFFFPTKEESFGLVLPEAALASGALCVINRSLDNQQEISGNRTLAFEFGSHYRLSQPKDPELWLKGVAQRVIGRYQQNEALRTRTFMRQQYNWNNIYENYYLPIFSESALW